MNKINGRTPEEIKKGLGHCSEDGCKGCNYDDDCNMADGFSVLAFDALALIQQLERERDAAHGQALQIRTGCHPAEADGQAAG